MSYLSSRILHRGGESEVRFRGAQLLHIRGKTCTQRRECHAPLASARVHDVGKRAIALLDNDSGRPAAHDDTHDGDALRMLRCEEDLVRRALECCNVALPRAPQRTRRERQQQFVDRFAHAERARKLQHTRLSLVRARDHERSPTRAHGGYRRVRVRQVVRVLGDTGGRTRTHA